MRFITEWGWGTNNLNSSHQKEEEINRRGGREQGLEMSQTSRAFQYLCLRGTQTFCKGNTGVPVPLELVSAFQTKPGPEAS